MIIIDIEIKKRNRLKEFFYKIHSTIENLLFSILTKLPEKFIPSFLIKWMDRYLTTRINQLKQQNVKQTWRNMYLQSAVDSIKEKSSQQRDKNKAPSDD